MGDRVWKHLTDGGICPARVRDAKIHPLQWNPNPLQRSGNMDKENMKEEVMEALETVEDPELHIDIVNLGLVYGVDIDDEGNVKVTMTLTAMGCPLAGMINEMVETAVKSVEGVKGVEVNIVWNPPWDKDRMSRYAKMALGIH
ncbi:FeS assembly SUF system protein [Desmospora sp. 8437]|nr:FeS assembly SUF system protein [Desmospora sp. 8437]